MHELNIELENNELIIYSDNPVVNSVLSEKKSVAEKNNIDMDIYVEPGVTFVGISDADIITMLSNLLDNAIEALDKEKEGKKIYIAMEEESKDFNIVIRNKSTFIDYNEISDFFTKGYSRKGSSRGLGLYNVKKICDEYGMSICCENEEINNENWLCFKINKAI